STRGNATTAATASFHRAFERASHHAIGVPTRRRRTVVIVASASVTRIGDQRSAKRRAPQVSFRAPRRRNNFRSSLRTGWVKRSLVRDLAPTLALAAGPAKGGGRGIATKASTSRLGLSSNPEVNMLDPNPSHGLSTTSGEEIMKTFIAIIALAMLPAAAAAA